MAQLDGWLLERFESFAHTFQRLTEKNCFWLARASVVLTWMGMAMSVVVFTPNNIRFSPVVMAIDISFGAGSIFAGWVMFQGIKLAEQNVESARKCSYASNQSKLLYPLRIFQTLLVLCAMLVTHVLAFTGFVAVWYFISCDPLPPCTSKIKKAIGWLQARRQDMTTPTSQPKPTPVCIASSLLEDAFLCAIMDKWIHQFSRRTI